LTIVTCPLLNPLAAGNFLVENPTNLEMHGVTICVLPEKD